MPYKNKCVKLRVKVLVVGKKTEGYFILTGKKVKRRKLYVLKLIIFVFKCERIALVGTEYFWKPETVMDPIKYVLVYSPATSPNPNNSHLHWSQSFLLPFPNFALPLVVVVGIIHAAEDLSLSVPSGRRPAKWPPQPIARSPDGVIPTNNFGNPPAIGRVPSTKNPIQRTVRKHA